MAVASTETIVVIAPLAQEIGSCGAWCTSIVGGAPVADGVGGCGAECTSSVVNTPVADAARASGAQSTFGSGNSRRGGMRRRGSGVGGTWIGPLGRAGETEAGADRVECFVDFYRGVGAYPSA